MPSHFDTQMELLNSICVSSFGAPEPVVYRHKSGGSVEVDAILTEPAPDETGAPGRYTELFIHDGSLEVEPVIGDSWVTSAGAVYSVFKVARDGGKGIVLSSRKA